MKRIQQTEQLSDGELKAVLRGDEASAGQSRSRSAPPRQSRAWTRSSSARRTSASWQTARTMRPLSRWTCSAATTSRRGWNPGRGWWRRAGKRGGGWNSKSEPGRHFFLSMDRKKGDKASSCYPLLTQTSCKYHKAFYFHCFNTLIMIKFVSLIYRKHSDEKWHSYHYMIALISSETYGYSFKRLDSLNP